MTIKKWVCPRCEKETMDYPAISRRDNKTEVCSLCGTAQALQDYFQCSREEADDMSVDIDKGVSMASNYMNWNKQQERNEK